MKRSKTITASLVFNVSAILFLTLAAAAQETPALSDPEVAHAAVTANQIDIDYAALALKRSKNAEVLKFAETMSGDHKAVIAQAVALVKKLSVTPKDNAVSKNLLAGADKTKKALAAKSSRDFDKAYIDNEVAYHKAVIAAVEQVLIPQSQNSELKQLLQNVVPALKAHLAHAEMVQQNVK